MLTIILPETDTASEVVLQFEHSLVSLSKWESVYEKPFFSKGEKTEEETFAYIDQMLLTKNAPADYLDRLRTPEFVQQINEYINSKQTATWFREEPGGSKSREVITAELIYYWMIQFQIPFPCENWHLNRLMTLIKICGIKQTKPKPMSRQSQAEMYRKLNEERRAALGTSG